LRKKGKEIVLVSSGAIALGKILTKTDNFSNQFYSTIGQTHLMNNYQKHFAKFGQGISQLLINTQYLKKHNKHIKKTIDDSFNHGNITIINENDALAKKSNNDILAAQISKTIQADLLIFLTNTNGILDKNNKTISKGTIKELKKHIKKDTSSFGTGGMQTKLKASKITKARTIIASAKEKEIIRKILEGEERGTILLNKKNKYPFAHY
jgi:glutamate 5-kinase